MVPLKSLLKDFSPPGSNALYHAAGKAKRILFAYGSSASVEDKQ